MIILAAIDLRLIVAVTVFLAVVSLIWFAMDFVNRSESENAENRLDMMNGSMRKGGDSKESKKDMLARVFEQASPAVAKHLQPKTVAEVGKLKSRLSEAGFRTEGASGVFLSLKVFAALGGVFLAGGITALTMV